jgi:hypothetical protein
MKYAAYDDVSIYAIGMTPDEAIANAKEATRDPNAHFKAAHICDEFAAYIEEHGWDASCDSFSIDARGFLVKERD